MLRTLGVQMVRIEEVSGNGWLEGLSGYLGGSGIAIGSICETALSLLGVPTLQTKGKYYTTLNLRMLHVIAQGRCFENPASNNSPHFSFLHRPPKP